MRQSVMSGSRWKLIFLKVFGLWNSQNLLSKKPWELCTRFVMKYWAASRWTFSVYGKMMMMMKRLTFHNDKFKDPGSDQCTNNREQNNHRLIKIILVDSPAESCPGKQKCDAQFSLANEHKNREAQYAAPYNETIGVFAFSHTSLYHVLDQR